MHSNYRLRTHILGWVEIILLEIILIIDWMQQWVVEEVLISLIGLW